MSGFVDGRGGAVADRIFAGILAAFSIALGGVAAAQTGRQEKPLQARPSDRVPQATAATYSHDRLGNLLATRA